jgi:hypothetical protein
LSHWQRAEEFAGYRIICLAFELDVQLESPGKKQIYQ